MAFTPSQRPTREWHLLVLALALVCAICIPLWQWQQASVQHTSGQDFSKWTAERIGRLLIGPEQIACYCAFTWAAFILMSRYLEVRRQRQAFSLDLLPTEVGVCI